MGLFRIKRELQFGVSNNAKPLRSPCMAGEEEYVHNKCILIIGVNNEKVNQHFDSYFNVDKFKRVFWFV